MIKAYDDCNNWLQGPILGELCLDNDEHKLKESMTVCSFEEEGKIENYHLFL